MYTNGLGEPWNSRMTLKTIRSVLKNPHSIGFVAPPSSAIDPVTLLPSAVVSVIVSFSLPAVAAHLPSNGLAAEHTATHAHTNTPASTALMMRLRQIVVNQPEWLEFSVFEPIERTSLKSA